MWSPGCWLAVRQLGFLSLSRSSCRAIGLLPSRSCWCCHPITVSPSTLGHSAPWLGEGSVALAAHSLPNAAVLAAPHRAVSAGGPWELVSLGQSSSHTRPCAGTALTLPFASGNGRWEAWKFPQSRNIAFWAARRGSHPVPRQSQPWLGTAGSLSARLDYQPQRCPLDGKHLVCLAPAAAICCLGRVAQGSGSILNKFQL